jgi:hypothetical protein
MTLKYILTSQPLSFWLSLLATLVALISLLLSLKNRRRAQELDTLQRITQLILKLTEVRSQIADATINLTLLRLALSEFQTYSLLKDPESKDDFAETKGKHAKVESDLVELEKRLEYFMSEVSQFNAKTDPSEIEGLLPGVDKLKRSVEDSNNFVIASIRAFESRTKP